MELYLSWIIPWQVNVYWPESLVLVWHLIHYLVKLQFVHHVFSLDGFWLVMRLLLMLTSFWLSIFSWIKVWYLFLQDSLKHENFDLHSFTVSSLDKRFQQSFLFLYMRAFYFWLIYSKTLSMTLYDFLYIASTSNHGHKK